ncbi:autotransporter family protein [Entomomonas asaccharolytica]|uniref:Autotransporter domain-containing protein n=1 Tax=Entomomonas asaccharolytica TaxID=2785331 RepID=A0A974RVM0_9GAMM|nr:autotransporter outer membrane beta-barrel domain-containing protein [Entomomonas asaccharolytica]QQP84288.1 autotransporter domain-containing protein [Entomomonas asaccharolytica]
MLTVSKLSKNIAYLLFFPIAYSLLTSQAKATTYDVGIGETYSTLKELSDAGVLANGDIVVVHNNDSSFAGETLSVSSLTLVSSDGTRIILSEAATSTPPAKGGLIYFTNNSVTLNIADIQVQNSTAQGVNNNVSSGLGGAIYANNDLSMANADDIMLNNNTALGGDNGANSGLGGAIYAYYTLDLKNSNNISFVNNKAIAGNPTSSTTTGSGHGGAIYASLINLTGANDITFSGNQAQGGDAGTLNAPNSGIGGAIYAGFFGIDMTGASNVVFSNNIAKGGSASTGGNADKSGLGGAISTLGPSVISGSSFINNQATTSNIGDMSSGLGGAIYNSGPSLTLQATAGNDITFSGNTHNQGGMGVTANSIYFGNVSSSALSTTFNVDVADGALVTMYDPLASQADDLITKSGSTLSNVNLTINKTGAGKWILGGHNDMASATTWNINQGTLYLELVNNKPVHIDLSNNNTATFNAAAGSTILFSPSAQAHLISGLDIALNAGSNVGMGQGGAFSYFELPAGADAPLLSLRADNSLTNDSNILNPDGTFSSGVYDYTYGLYWRENDPLSHDLVATIKSKTYNSELGGSSSTTGPTGIASQSSLGSMLTTRLHWNFECLDDCRDTTYTDGKTANCNSVCSQPSEKSANVWFRPTYSYTNQTNGTGFHINTPGFALGIDNCFDRNFFLGFGLFGTLPEFRSKYADIDAQTINAAVYGGTLLPGKIELGLMAGLGHTWYDQKRKVRGYHYNSDYESNNWNLGINLGRRFKLNESWTLRPFTAYEYMSLNVQSYKEKQGVYSLKVKSHRENFHFLKTGVDLTWSNNRDLDITGKVYHSGFYGDTKANTHVTFVSDPNATRYNSYGDKLDNNALGLGIGSAYKVNKDFTIEANYNFEKGKHSYTHYANLNFVYKF